MQIDFASKFFESIFWRITRLEIELFVLKRKISPYGVGIVAFVEKIVILARSSMELSNS